MLAGPSEIIPAQARHERDAVVPQLRQLVQQGLDVSRAVVPGTCDLVLVPGLKPRRLLGENDPDAAGKAAALGLDEMTDDLLRAPLARRRMPSEDALRQRAELGAQRRHRGVQAGGHFHGRQRVGRRGHGALAQTLVTIADGSSSSARRSAPASSASCSWLIAKIRHCATLPGRYFRISVSGSIDTVRVAAS